MSFTAQELANIANAVLDFHVRGKAKSQIIQNRPLYNDLLSGKKTFPGGKDFITEPVKGVYTTSLAGYTHDDQLSFYNPATNKRVRFQWKEHFIGTVITHTELKIDGIEVNDESADASTSQVDGREAHALANLLDEKNDDLGEDYAKSLDTLIHGDGTSDTKALAGIRSILLENPDVGTTGGINRALSTWWQNRCLTTTGGGVITSSASNGGAILIALQKEMRLLGKDAQGGTRWRFFAGSDFYDAMERELRANGTYTTDGFMREAAADGGMAKLKFQGKAIEWDPTMDDISKSKFLYVIDMKRIRLLYMNGQRMKKHKPSRPYDRLVMYNGISSTCVMTAQQLNTSLIAEIA